MQRRVQGSNQHFEQQRTGLVIRFGAHGDKGQKSEGVFCGRMTKSNVGLSIIIITKKIIFVIHLNEWAEQELRNVFQHYLHIALSDVGDVGNDIS